MMTLVLLLVRQQPIAAVADDQMHRADRRGHGLYGHQKSRGGHSRRAPLSTMSIVFTGYRATAAAVIPVPEAKHENILGRADAASIGICPSSI